MVRSCRRTVRRCSREISRSRSRSHLHSRSCSHSRIRFAKRSRLESNERRRRTNHARSRQSGWFRSGQDQSAGSSAALLFVSPRPPGALLGLFSLQKYIGCTAYLLAVDVAIAAIAVVAFVVVVVVGFSRLTTPAPPVGYAGINMHMQEAVLFCDGLTTTCDAWLERRPQLNHGLWVLSCVYVSCVFSPPPSPPSLN